MPVTGCASTSVDATASHGGALMARAQSVRRLLVALLAAVAIAAVSVGQVAASSGVPPFPK
jgi:hypothetical protein